MISYFLFQETNRKLIEANEEMHAQVLNRGLEEGKAILFSHDTAKANLESMSIARELEGLSDSQVIFKATIYNTLLFYKNEHYVYALQSRFFE